MVSSMLGKVFQRSKTEFVRTALSRGLSAQITSALNAAATEICLEQPELMLESRELFEEVATRAVFTLGSHCELSFPFTDELASAVEEARQALRGRVEELARQAAERIVGRELS